MGIYGSSHTEIGQVEFWGSWNKAFFWRLHVNIYTGKVTWPVLLADIVEKLIVIQNHFNCIGCQEHLSFDLCNKKLYGPSQFDPYLYVTTHMAIYMGKGWTHRELIRVRSGPTAYTFTKLAGEHGCLSLSNRKRTGKIDESQYGMLRSESRYDYEGEPHWWQCRNRRVKTGQRTG